MIRDNTELQEQRESMVRDQLRPRGIEDQRVIDAFLKVPRHEFIPEKFINQAYSDFPLPIGSDQTISQPYMVALMTELLQLKPTDKVLEVGTGSGYQAAILAELSSRVYSVDRISALADRASEVLKGLGYSNIDISVSDGSCGLKDKAPFDAIIVTCGAPSIPEPLKEQLSDGGRLVVPVGDSFSQKLFCVKRSADDFKIEEKTSCIFVPLIGKHGWDDPC